MKNLLTTNKKNVKNNSLLKYCEAARAMNGLLREVPIRTPFAAR